jgi:hypothetical protein
MFRTLSTAAIALTTTALIAAAPAKAQAQYVVPQQTGVAFSIATPNFALGIGTPVYRPVPVAPVVPYPAPVFVPRPVYPAPYYAPYRGWGYGYPYYHNHNHYHGPRRW